MTRGLEADATDAQRDSLVARLDGLYAEVDALRRPARADRHRDLVHASPWRIFARLMRLLPAQSYGRQIQGYVANFFGWPEVDASLNRGDFLVDGQHAEFKVSFKIGANQVNFVQIRLFQDVERYVCLVVDEQLRCFRFDLTKEQMNAEVALFNSASHGVRSVFDDNPSKEWAIRFTWSDDNVHRIRWTENYLVSGDVLPDMMDDHRYESAAQLRERLGMVSVAAAAST